MDDFKDSCDFISVEPESNPESVRQWLSIVQPGNTTAKGTQRSEISTKAKKHLSSLGWVFAYFRKGKGRELRYKSPKGRWFYSLATACMSCVNEDDESRREQIVPKSDSSGSIKRKRVVDCDVNGSTPKKKKKMRVDDCETTPFNVTKRSSDLTVNVDVLKKKKKRVNGIETAAFNVTLNQEKNRSSDLTVNVDVSKKKKRVNDIETAAFNVTLNQEKNRSSDLTVNVDVLKKRKRVNDIDTPPFKAEIRPRFEKSLKKVLQVMEKKNKNCEKESVKFWRKDYGPEKNCDVCCVCHRGGKLLLCDGCPSAFHHTCLGFSTLPNEELWFCPCCCCDICGSIETSRNSKLMTCEQCQRRFHLKCLKEEPFLVSCKGWFCSRQCNSVFTSLQELQGRKIVVGDEGLVWTLMRAPNDDEHYDDEQISKLDSAVEILHQGFEPTKDPFSGRDLVEELIFRRDGNGVGRGFYTVFIERNNEPITVAAMRVDKDVAEIPLVATLVNHRRSGMCRLLMDELEKQMSRMRVCRLVLPAASEVVSTWTERFGFEVMESWERLELVKHGTLDFVGTVMCHKFLKDREESGESNLTE